MRHRLKGKNLYLIIFCIVTSTVCSEGNSLKNKQEAIEQNRLGLEMLQSNSIDKSIEYFRSAIDLDNTIPEYHNNLGFCFFKLSDFPEAKKHYLKSIQIDETYSQGYYNIGVLLQKSNDFKGALDNYTKSLRFNSEYPEAIYNRALVSMMLGRKKEAVDGFEKFIKVAGLKYPEPTKDAKKRIFELKK